VVVRIKMEPAPKIKLTEAEYLEMERKATFKSEFFRGEIFAMTGANLKHNMIVGNCIVTIGNQLKGKPCRVFSSDLRVKVDKSGLHTYPDLSIVCGKPILLDDKADTLLNPIVLIEVLSKSTEDYDRGNKFSFYRQIESLQEYILISSEAPKMEIFRKLENGDWLFSESRIGQDFLIESIDFVLKLSDVYSGVE
jgi:Uma2 family endonuclease